MNEAEFDAANSFEEDWDRAVQNISAALEGNEGNMFEAWSLLCGMIGRPQSMPRYEYRKKVYNHDVKAQKRLALLAGPNGEIVAHMLLSLKK